MEMFEQRRHQRDRGRRLQLRGAPVASPTTQQLLRQRQAPEHKRGRDPNVNMVGANPTSLGSGRRKVALSATFRSNLTFRNRFCAVSSEPRQRPRRGDPVRCAQDERGRP